jgi:hypothetical protein
MFARYDYSPSNNIANLGSSEPNNPRPTLFNTRTLTYGATWIVTPTMTNEFRSNWSRQDGATLLTLDSNGGAVPFSPSVYPGNFPQQNSFFEVYVAGVTEILGRNGEGTQGQLNFVDNFTWVHGNHQFKFGVDYRYLFPSALSRAADLDVLFLTTAAAQQGLAEIATAARSPRVDYAYSNFSAYAQDTWKLTQRLTATYGLRWDLNPPPHGRNGTTLYAANDTNNLSALAFATAGTPLWNTQYSNFAPRVGLAYRLNESGTNVIRGGFGMFYDLPAGAISNVVILSPNVVSGPTLLNVPYPPSTVTIPALSTNPPYANVTVADRNLASPFTLEWNIALEHAFDKNETITVSYIGANGRNLIGQEQYFSLNANFPTVSVIRSDRSSNYNALQAQYQRHLSHGLQGLASYTWAHSLDNASNSSSSLVPGTAIDPSIDYGPSDYDIRHTFSGALTYEVPMAGPAAAKAILGHWSLDSIFTARSSMPVNVTVSRNLGYGTYSFRPDLVSGVPDYLTNPNVPGGWLINNTPVSANQLGPFLVSPQLRQGTLGRNALSGFPMDELDFAVRRQINLTERYNLQIRAEFFNILNHPNFANPSGALGSATPTGATTFSTSTFGQSPSMLNAALGSGGQVGGFNPLYGIGGPRSIQLSLKFGF